MAVTELYTFSEAVGTTEWSCTADSAGPVAKTDDGVFQLWLDLSDMVAGDVLEIRFYEKVRGADTQRQFWPMVTLTGPQSPQDWLSPSFILLHGWDFTVKATSGTITITGSVRQVA